MSSLSHGARRERGQAPRGRREARPGFRCGECGWAAQSGSAAAASARPGARSRSTARRRGADDRRGRVTDRPRVPIGRGRRPTGRRPLDRRARAGPGARRRAGARRGGAARGRARRRQVDAAAGRGGASAADAGARRCTSRVRSRPAQVRLRADRIGALRRPAATWPPRPTWPPCSATWTRCEPRCSSSTRCRPSPPPRSTARPAASPRSGRSAAALIRRPRQRGMATLLVGPRHQGRHRSPGPRLLEHLVDVVLPASRATGTRGCAWSGRSRTATAPPTRSAASS